MALFALVHLNKLMITASEPESYWIKAIKCTDDGKDDILYHPRDRLHALGTNQHDNSDNIEEGQFSLIAG